MDQKMNSHDHTIKRMAPAYIERNYSVYPVKNDCLNLFCIHD